MIVHQALTLLSIGFAYAQLNEFRRALQYFNETLLLAQSLKERRLEAATGNFPWRNAGCPGDIGSALEAQTGRLLCRQRKRQGEASS